MYKINKSMIEIGFKVLLRLFKVKLMYLLIFIVFKYFFIFWGFFLNGLLVWLN